MLRLLEFEQVFLVGQRLVGLREIRSDLVGREGEALNLVPIDGFQIVNRNLVLAGFADVFGAVGRDIHLLAADALGDPAKGMHGLFGGPARIHLMRLLNHRIALAPEVRLNDGRHAIQHPFAFGFEQTAHGLAVTGGVIGPVDALGRGVSQEPGQGLAREVSAIAGAVTGLIQEAHHGLFPPVLQEQVIHELPNRRFVRMGHELLVLPLIAKGRRASERAAELGADGDRGLDSLDSFLPLPLGHGRDHGVKEATGGGGSVNGFLEGNEVAIAFTENVGKIEEFPRIPRQPGELREDEGLDAAVPDIGEHPPAFGVAADGFAAHPFQVIHLRHCPALGFGVEASPGFVAFGAFALGLVLRRDANPDADGPALIRIFLHATGSYRKARLEARKKFCFLRYIGLPWAMQFTSATRVYAERQLAALAKRFRSRAGISKAAAARQLGVNRGSIQQAEEYPDTSLTRLRVRMIETYSPFRVMGPVFYLKRK